MLEGGGNISELANWLQQTVEDKLKIDLAEAQLEQFAQYYDLLIETNRHFNLTAITEPEEVYCKHYYDSLSLAMIVPVDQIQTVIDVGTGAGFPGIPLKIAYPHLDIVLLDSLKKRVHFLEIVIEKLGLKGIRCIHGRAEDFGNREDYRQRFDLSVARAVAKLNVLTEYCLPFVKVGGSFVAMKGSDVEEEINQAKRAFKILGQASYLCQSISLPDQRGERTLIRIDKKKKTPRQYPRRAGVPKRNPL